MNGEAEFSESVFSLPLPACLVESIKNGSWADLANSPRIEAVFGQAPVRPRFHSISQMTGMTTWWREELDEETLQCYLGTSEARPMPGTMSRLNTVIIGNLGPDLPFVLDYRGSFTNPSVHFLGEGDSWKRISDNVCALIHALRPAAERSMTSDEDH
ncbi:hypothetical protein EDD93_2930 [Streptomyces sp. 840.1]|uniref:hypothetical protein n=1 Tax=Streptomyces sp. 840.1 TaxID=2485152 RepID=UPI000FA8EEE1|nr:hypothetical protein [Streptomyces sp. 840.1]ROQ68463.1 hypothetical protein EDD93_2930 [Streptomyces sp. 840.1]